MKGGCAACMERMRNAQKTSFSKFKARKNIEDLGVKGRLILKLN